MAGRAHPARAALLPFGGTADARDRRAGGDVAAAGSRLTSLVAAKAGATRAKIFAARGAEKAAEAEPVVGKRDRAVRITFAGCDGIAEPRDQQVAHRDLCCRLLSACRRFQRNRR